MNLLLALLLATTVPPVNLHRTETQREGVAPFDLAPDDVSAAQIESCRVEETIPMGAGTAEKRVCSGALDAEAAARRCKRDALPRTVTPENCLDQYQRGYFRFAGELKELIVTRRRDGKRVAAFKVPEGAILANFQPVAGVVLIGVSDGQRIHYAVVGTQGVLRAPPLGDEAWEVSGEKGRIRVTGKARAMYIDLIPRDGELKAERHP